MTSKHSVDLLLEACGVQGQIQVDVQRIGKGEAVEKRLFLPLAVIGRGDNTDLPLIDPQVSRRHAYLQVVGGRLFGIDLRSRTGTHWEAGGATGVGWVPARAPIRIGPFVVRLDVPPPAADAAPPNVWNPLADPPGHAENAPPLMLQWLAGMQPVPPWRMTSTLALMGRRTHSYGLVIDDPSLSSFHCSLLRTPLGTWVMDLLGLGGVVLNNRRVRWGRLDDGDHLHLGRYKFRVFLGESALAAGREEEHAEMAAAGSTHRLTHTAAVANGNRSPAREPAQTAGGSLVAANPPYLTRTDLNEALLAPLFNQFAAMQNQMFDQFQQALMMMVEMFSEMQRDQVSLIRQEVDRLHQITAELQTLQNELAAHPVLPGWVAPASGEAVLAADVAGPAPQTAAAESPPESAAGPPSETAGQPPVAEKPASPASPLGLNLPQPPLAAVDGEVHMWLYEKIAALQRERQSRLQKIINYLRGK